jgi:predicted amidohydrolase YtcJ
MVLDKADLVLHEGAVLGHPESDSVAIAGGCVVAHGRYGDFRQLIGPQTHLIRLAGRTVAPGFIDCHLHFMEAASVATGLSLLRCRAIGDVLADLRVAAGKTPPGNWLRAFGCDEALMRERRGPTREELDRSVPKNPLRLRHQTLHASWLNSRAISQLGLDQADFKPPAGALMVRDGIGRLTGLVAGMEEWLTSRMPRVTAAELEARARVFSRELAAAGVTAFTDATVRNGPDEVALFARLVAGGAITQRMSMMVGPAYSEAIPVMRQMAAAAGIGIAGVKFMDVALWEPPRLVRAVADAMAQGADCAFHCTEVQELEAALTAIAAARSRVRVSTLDTVACRLEHGGLIPPNYPERIAALRAWVVTNPSFVYYRGAKYAGEPGLIPYLYRARSLAAAGINLAAGTDAPVAAAKPLTAIAAAVTRVSREGYELGLDERISADAAFALFTTAAARLARLGSGEIAAGEVADLIVLAANPLALKPDELINLGVDLTIVGGHVIYERGHPVASNSAVVGNHSA